MVCALVKAARWRARWGAYVVYVAEQPCVFTLCPLDEAEELLHHYTSFHLK